MKENWMKENWKQVGFLFPDVEETEVLWINFVAEDIITAAMWNNADATVWNCPMYDDDDEDVIARHTRFKEMHDIEEVPAIIGYYRCGELKTRAVIFPDMGVAGTDEDCDDTCVNAWSYLKDYVINAHGDEIPVIKSQYITTGGYELFQLVVAEL